MDTRSVNESLEEYLRADLYSMIMAGLKLICDCHVHKKNCSILKQV